uniref:Uncharacterized protein n=1 Tax=Aplanochytrium stocchinoi TaxID=215587 RepID=A0A7S3PL23_9STRA|mmetsp:Transcript_5594/g.6571  ORF Transcript_5594/g.6571 Transcript_5594/m.6571 type:complete len:337 (-) Transcript_5594:238-1248(-)
MEKPYLLLSSCLMGIGISLCQNTLYGSISYLSMNFGQEIYLWVCAMINLPCLPVSLYQLVQEKRYSVSDPTSASTPLLSHINDINEYQNQRNETKRLCWQLCATYLIGAVLIGAIPFIHTKSALLGLSLVVGFLQANSFCVAFRMVSLPTSGEAKFLQAALSFGFQGSSICVLFSQILSGFRVNTKPESFDMPMMNFYFVNACFSFVSILGVYNFYRMSTTFTYHNNINDRTESQIETSTSADKKSLFSWKGSGLDKTWQVVLALFVTIFGSVIIFPFYSYIPSSEGTLMANMILNRNLFYVKAISDTGKTQYPFSYKIGYLSKILGVFNRTIIAI